MIGYFVFFISGFLIERVKNKIIIKFMHNGLKMIKYTPAWHREHDKILDLVLDWILV